MMKILFFIESLEVGGAEKSLVTLLNLSDLENHSVDLLMLKKGTFLSEVPSNVNCIFLKDLKPNLFQRVKYFFTKKIGQLHPSQHFWKIFKDDFPLFQKNYDVAIAYGQGFSTYYVAEKVYAKKKFAWINTDYEATGYKSEFDFPFYNKFQAIIAVSETVQKSLLQLKYKISKQIDIILIPDIVNTEEIFRKSEEEIETFDINIVNIVSVGRLVGEKNFQLAITTAKLLKSRNYNFKWQIVGNGIQYQFLQNLIMENDLQESVLLSGMKKNPYPYIRNCDIYVQTSKFEGLGLTVIEAKILGKPVVSTNFPTAYQIIEDGETGLICDMTPKSLADALEKLIKDKPLKNKFSKTEAKFYDQKKDESLGSFYSLLTENNKF